MVEPPHLSPDLLNRLREERLTQIPHEIQALWESQASWPISADHFWEMAFQYTLHPEQHWIDPAVLKLLKTQYRVSTFEELLPRYIGQENQWGALISPRVLGPSKKLTAHIEQWFVSEPSNIIPMFQRIEEEWPFPHDGIAFPIHPNHRCVPSLKTLSRDIRLEESAYIMHWRTPPPLCEYAELTAQLTVQHEKDLDGWWPAFQQIFLRDQQRLEEDTSDGRIDQLRKDMHRCQQRGGIITVYDSSGLAGHLSWKPGTDLELLIPECPQISYILVRHDRRGQGIGKYLCHLAAQHMSLDAAPLVCTRVQGDNPMSRVMIEKVGGHRIWDVYIVS